MRLLLLALLIASPAYGEAWMPKAADARVSAPSQSNESSILLNEIFSYPDATTSDDDDGDPSGYFELVNVSNQAKQIGSWTLGLDDSPYSDFEFPPGTEIPASSYLRIWTNGKADTSDPANMHAAFYLMGSTTVTLKNARGTTLAAWTMEGLYEDVAYGRCQETPCAAEFDYFDTPTPGTINLAANRVAEVAKPYMSVSAGDNPSIGAYTTDGTTPTFGITANGLLDLTIDSGGLVDVTNGDWHDDGRYSGPAVADTATADTASTAVTVVGWEANTSELRLVGRRLDWQGTDIAAIFSRGGVNADENVYRGLDAGPIDGNIYFGLVDDNYNIYATNDGFETARVVGRSPREGASDPYDEFDSQDILFRTPLGDFMVTKDGTPDTATVWWSQDGMQTWDQQTVDGTPDGTTDHRTIESTVAWYYNDTTETLYIALAEYTADNLNGHSFYLATYTSATSVGDFVKVHTFDPLDTDGGTADNQGSLYNSVSHIHVVRFDQYTGDLWVGTGDSYNRSKIVVCAATTDCASWANYTIWGTGTEEERILAVWSTPDAVWFNTDSSSPQYVNRLPRSSQSAGLWPTVSTVYEEDDVVPAGIYVFVKSNGAGSVIESLTSCVDSNGDAHSPCDVPDRGIVPGGGITLEAGDSVVARAIGASDYRERYLLDDNSHWFSTTVPHPSSGFIELMATSRGEGAAAAQRDSHARVFGIYENGAANIDIQEVLIGPTMPAIHGINAQLEPHGRDSAGNLYFSDRASGIGGTPFYIYQLDWVDTP